MKIITLSMMLGLSALSATAQPADSSSLNYHKLYALALTVEIEQALQVLDTASITSMRDLEFKQQFEDRFRYENDRTDYLDGTDTALLALHGHFQQYWRKGLLEPTHNFDESFLDRLVTFFQQENMLVPFIDGAISRKNLKQVYRSYIESKGYYTTDLGRTGKFIDFLVWKDMDRSSVTVPLISDTITTDLHIMTGFVSLGWISYVKLGNHYPSGWATSKGLFGVRDAYDTNSEEYRIQFLAHEGQHYLDNREFPQLRSGDMEYRAKLSELYFGQSLVYERLVYFINNAKNDPDNGHPFANYCVARDMSKKLFGAGQWPPASEWMKVDAGDISQAARELFEEHTTALRAKGNAVKTVLVP